MNELSWPSTILHIISDLIDLQQELGKMAYICLSIATARMSSSSDQSS